MQEYCTSHYATAISSDDSEEAKKMLRQYIQQYVQERRYAVEGLSAEQLSDKIYEDMAGYSILRKWIYMDGIEEVNVNAWNDIEVIHQGGRSEKSRSTSLLRSRPSTWCGGCCPLVG